MSNDKEKFVLAQWIQKYAADEPSIVLRWWFNPVLWVLITVSLVALHFYYATGVVGIWAVIIISSFAGSIVGAFTIVQVTERNWSFMKAHINIQSVKKRHRELNN